ncbi:MAG: BMP family protein [Cyanobacteria bacterium P01_H01_bin.153]
MINSVYRSRVQSALAGVPAVLLVTLLGACGASSPEATEPAAEAPAETETEAEASAEDGVKFALVLSGPAADQSWNQAAFDATQELEAEGVEVAISESVDPADVAAVLRQYAEEGYGMIVAHSFSYQDAVMQVAAEFPDVNFAWAGGINGTTENVADYDQPFYQGAYLVGMVAAELSTTGQLGALYGFDIPVCHAMGEAMLAGAQTIRPEATLTSAAVGDWYDVAKAKEAALSQAETGVDFWIGCGQGPTLGQIEAAKESDGFATGYVGDMTSLGPEVIASNLLWNMKPLFDQMLEDTTNDTFDNQFYDLGVPDNVIQVEVTSDFEGDVGEAILTTLDETKEKIASGELEVPFVPQ